MWLSNNMRKTVKVVLLSTLVLPGLGHLVLKKYALAATFVASFVYLLLGIIKEIHNKTQHVVESIIRGEIPLEVTAIKQTLINQGVLESSQLSTSSYLLFIVWAISAIDAYRIAKKNI
jgi:hypothetical protein